MFFYKRVYIGLVTFSQWVIAFEMKNEIACRVCTPKSLVACLLIWLGLVSLFFSPAVFGNKVIAPMDCLECVFRPFADRPIENVHNHFVTDGISQYIPYKWAIKKSIEEDGYMGWNPYTFNGSPGPDNTMTSPGDLNNLLYGVLPFWTAWNLGVLLQFFIAGCGMILLLRHYKIPMWGILLAAISFAFYSQFVLWIYHKWVGAMIWSPFLVWAFLRNRSKGYLINVPAIIFMALIWRGGHLQSCLFAFCLVACMWLDEIWKKNGVWLNRKQFFRITFSYLLVGVLGALLSLDVFVDTLPRMSGCKSMPFVWGVNNMPSFTTLLFPHVMGIPETLDLNKGFGLDLFDIKYGGGIVFILALIGCFNPRAPRTAKILFWMSALLVCTPLITYLYSRSTVIMGLGMAWLAAWQVYDFTKVQYSPVYWKRIAYILIGILLLWCVVSVVIDCFHESISELLKRIMNSESVGYRRAGRGVWNELRVERFLSQILIWDWRNLVFSVSLILGVTFCYRIKVGSRKNPLWMMGLALLTFIDMLTFSGVWITYSEVPTSSYLYREPVWMSSLKREVRDGSVAVHNPVNDRDFLCLNHLSTYNVRLADGYETFRPEFLQPHERNRFETMDYAQAGISHILSDTKWKETSFPGWKLVMTEKDFKLYANPDYKGRYILDGKHYIKENWRTCNRIHLSIPAGAQSLTILESYHKGWRAYKGESELPIERTDRGGMFIHLPSSSQGDDVLLEFHMPYREVYYPIMVVTALGLLVVAFRQRRKRCCQAEM